MSTGQVNARGAGLDLPERGGREYVSHGMNRLEHERSPYLLQHATNPVDWYPWGEQAFAAARDADKPIFLSIGYSTCHWCHVMERESFSDPEVARLLADAFVAVKVDREERPDLDAHFMEVCTLLSGGGGWPLTILLTPSGMPFFAATYIPPRSTGGRTGLIDLVPHIAELWRDHRDEIVETARSIGAELARPTPAATLAAADAERLLADGFQQVRSVHDEVHGGFGTAPKFPMAGLYPFLLRWWKRSGDASALEVVERGLHAMRDGGIFDQVGFGFHRYATDDGWLVPHFEKMLYDQALLVEAYVEAWRATGDEEYRGTAEQVAAYLLRDLRLPEGGFASAEDADSDGEEGAFYRWEPRELSALLGSEPSSVGLALHEGVLHRVPGGPPVPAQVLRRLFEAREHRRRPARDGKVLADWNGLAIGALARAGAAFDRPDLVTAADTAADFIFERMRTPDGALLHRWCAGEAAIPGFAEDYAFLVHGLIELYEAGLELRHLERSIDLAEQMIGLLWDPVGAGFFQSPAGAGAPWPRKPLADGSLPSANSLAFLDLLVLARLTGRTAFRERAEAMLPLFGSLRPLEAGWFLVGLDFLLGPSREVVIAGDPEHDDTRAMLRAMRRRFLPRVTVLVRPSGPAGQEVERLAPDVSGPRAAEVATACVCEESWCHLPTTEVDVALQYLDAP